MIDARASENSDTRGRNVRISRACPVCLADSPHRRVVFVECGHAICRACWERLVVTQDELLLLPWERHCPCCRNLGEVMTIKEQSCNEAFDEREKRLTSELDRYYAPILALFHAWTRASDTSCVAWTVELLVEITEIFNNAQSAAFEAVRGPIEDEEAPSLDEAILKHNIMMEKVAKALEDDAFAKRLDAVFEAIRVVEVEAHERQAKVAELIGDMEKENEESATLGLCYSRACGGCDEQVPRRRVFFTACGHAVCRECEDSANEVEKDACPCCGLGPKGKKKCPDCGKVGDFVSLYEELIEDEDTK